MRALKDYTGRKFGRLTAQARINKGKCRFLCECGNIVALVIKGVVSGDTSSCGCIQREILIARNQTHGMSQQYRSTYRSWKDMRARCLNANDSDYANYGGRGISVCERWNEFASFFEDLGERPTGTTLDRKDTNGNYEPSNCRWADAKTQANNKRSNRMVTINDQSQTLQQWADQFGIDRSKVRYRLNVGYGSQESFQSGDLRRGNITNPHS